MYLKISITVYPQHTAPLPSGSLVQMLLATLCYQWSHGPWLSRYPYPPPISSRVPSWRHLLQIMITRTYLSLSTVVPATKCGHTPQWSHPRTDGTRFSCREIQLTSLNAKVGLCIYNSVCIISISITARIYFSLYRTLSTKEYDFDLLFLLQHTLLTLWSPLQRPTI